MITHVPAKKILIADSDETFLTNIKNSLQTEGHSVLTATNGSSALEFARKEDFDLLIMDVVLPGKDGWEVLTELRKNSKTRDMPVAFLSSRDNEADEVISLELGADEYLVKPVNERLLQARLKRHLRRTVATRRVEEKAVSTDWFEIDPPNYSVKLFQKELNLTKREFEVFNFLSQRAGKVVKRDALLKNLWNEQDSVGGRTIDVHIRKIREKLGERYADLIQTIRGVGYKVNIDKEPRSTQ